MNPMLKMIHLAAEKAEWSSPLSIEWDAAGVEDNPVATIRIPGGGDDCSLTFGPLSKPFSADWDFQLGSGSVLTVSAETVVYAIEMWLTNHKTTSN